MNEQELSLDKRWKEIPFIFDLPSYMNNLHKLSRF